MENGREAKKRERVDRKEEGEEERGWEQSEGEVRERGGEEERQVRRGEKGGWKDRGGDGGKRGRGGWCGKRRRKRKRRGVSGDGGREEQMSAECERGRRVCEAVRSEGMVS